MRNGKIERTVRALEHIADNLKLIVEHFQAIRVYLVVSDPKDEGVTEHFDSGVN